MKSLAPHFTNLGKTKELGDLVDRLHFFKQGTISPKIDLVEGRKLIAGIYFNNFEQLNLFSNSKSQRHDIQNLNEMYKDCLGTKDEFRLRWYAAPVNALTNIEIPGPTTLKEDFPLLISNPPEEWEIEEIELSPAPR